MVVLFFLLPLSRASLAGAQEPETKARDKPAIADPALIDRAGFRDLLKRYDSKPLLVYFWATWCEPCRDEYPMINELARKFAPRGLAVVGISLDGEGEITLVRRFLVRNNPIFPNYRLRPGDEAAFIQAVNPKWSGAIPATFCYGRDGREASYLLGSHSREDFEKVIQALLEPFPKSKPDRGKTIGRLARSPR